MKNSEVSSLQTLAEASGFRKTGRIDEVERLCAAFAHQWPEAVRVLEYGRSAQGRPLLALVVSRAGSLDSAELGRLAVPVLMLQGGIHPGESDGKDAGFIALRELLSGEVAGGVLERVAVLFVPAFNTDGHERVGRANRPNQNGPEETGWRATAQNLNLNRDYMKADAPEMQAMLGFLNQWDPLVCADLHVTDGADFEPDISLQAEPINQGDERLRASGVQLRDSLISRLAAQGSMPLPFYPDLARTDDPASGFVLTVYSPRFSTGYFPQRNRFTVLVETHSWKDYATRVRVTRNTIIGLVELVGLHGKQLLREAGEADSAAAQLGGAEMTLDYRSSWREHTRMGQAESQADDANARMIEFRGYAYTRTLSPISGDLMTVYDPKTPQIWRVPFRDRVEASLVVRAPKAGYVVPPEHAEIVGAKLTLHGIGYEPTRQLGSAQVEEFRISRAEFSPEPFEGRQRVALSGEWRAAEREVAKGSLFVPISQKHSRLIVALLEPQAPDSLAAWGFFNGCFEQKEQIEPYVAEQIARAMFDANPALQAEFTTKLKEDSAFAADPAARLDFFCRRHASYDQKRHLYPILRLSR